MSRQGLQKWWPQGVDSGSARTLLHSVHVNSRSARSCSFACHTAPQQPQHCVLSLQAEHSILKRGGYALCAAMGLADLAAGLLGGGGWVALLLADRGSSGPTPLLLLLIIVPATSAHAVGDVAASRHSRLVEYKDNYDNSLACMQAVAAAWAHHQGLAPISYTLPLASLTSFRTSAGSSPVHGTSPLSATCPPKCVSSNNRAQYRCMHIKSTADAVMLNEACSTPTPSRKQSTIQRHDQCV